MIFKRFKNISILYLSIIVFLTGVGVYVLFNTYFWLTSFWIFLINLRFTRKEHLKLAHFLVSIEQEDFSPPYSKNFEDFDLSKAFDQLSKVIISLRDEAQVNYQYLQTIINHINTAIICVDQSDKIILSNKSSIDLFKKHVLRNIDSLSISSVDLPDILRKLRAEEKKLVKFNINGELYNYLLQVAEFKLKEENFRLISFQNVQSELEQKELESWQKLTRVITHEIMNSAIPISNLSGLVYNQLYDEHGKFAQEVSIDQESDIKEGLKTIENRSKGLVNFVEATRNFTKMPVPELEELDINMLTKRVVSLLKPKITHRNVDLKINIEQEDLKILADKSLIEQALINLLLNALDALKEERNPILKIDALRNEENHVSILIEDNGMGISANELENIFIPFYTTKRQGSGIGLSLTKQIMFLHKGNISVKSELKKGTKFVLTF